MDNPKQQKSVHLLVQSVEYILSLQASDDLLYIELESKYDSQLWKNTFTSTYVEEITQKTGSYKKFPVFVQMVISAMSLSSDQVTIEILTFQDLENMKQQKMQQSGQSFKSSSSSSSALPKNNKRYIIVSYSSEFDKVHYPLPLFFEENIGTDKLKIIITRMKEELNDIKSNKSSDQSHLLDSSLVKKNNEQQRNENEQLKVKLKRLEEMQTQKIGAIEVDNIIREKNALVQELEASKSLNQREQTRLTNEVNIRDRELALKMSESTAFKKELAKFMDREEMDNMIKGYILSMDKEEESQLQQVKKQMMKVEKELEKSNLEIEQNKKIDNKQKQRIKQLELEIESSMKKFSHKQLTDRLYSPFSAGSKKSNYSAPNRGGSPASSKQSFNSRNSSQNSNGSTRTNPIKPQNPNIRNNPIRKPAIQSATTKVTPVHNKPINRSPAPNRTLPIALNRPQPPAISQHRPSPLTRQPLHNNNSPNFQKQNIPPPNRQPKITQSSVKQVRRVEFSDNHLYTKQMAPNKASELDNKINNLRNMLQNAKK